MKIDNYISELLYEHDCVIVTDLGGFITHYRPATLNKNVNTLIPPSKKVAFNASLKNNDGLLANHISNREALNYSDASKVIAEFSKHANEQMLAGKKLKIEKVGILYHDSDQNIQFLPDQNANYLIDSFGLSPIHAKMIRSEKAIPAENPTIPVSTINEVAKDRKPFKWKLVEVIPAAAVLALLLMVPPVLDRFNTNMSSLLPFSRMDEFVDDVKGVTHERAPITVEYTNPFEIPPSGAPGTLFKDEEPTVFSEETQPATDNRLESMDADVESSVPVSSEIKSTDVSSALVSGYFIIGGCFQYESNAESHVAHLKSRNIDAGIIGQNRNGLYMVSLFNTSDPEEAKSALEEIKSSSIPTAWIYKK